MRLRRAALAFAALGVAARLAIAGSALGADQISEGMPGVSSPGAFNPSLPAGPSFETVRLAQGRLEGPTDGTVTSFKGVPFAAPPVGPLRWRPPQPAAIWRGTREASGYGAACPQPQPKVRPSEDCLFLNVWTPTARARAAKLPVMVWIHGGGFNAGTASTPYFDGATFAQHGVVFVTLNYRLGRLGFFAHPALDRVQAGGLGNYGLMDQIAALQWVKANIGAFGGDPGNVTIFGESAGGASVEFLLIAPAARGLFAKAGVESGGGGATPAPTLAESEAMGSAFAEAHGVRGDDDAAAVALRALPAAELLEASESYTPTTPRPMVDGVLIPENIAEAFAAGRQARVPFLEGANSAEAGLSTDDPRDAALVFDQLALDHAKVVGFYGDDPVKAATDVLLDLAMIQPMRSLARRMAEAGQPVFVYRFSYVTPRLRGTAPGATHGAEVPFVFGNLSDEPGLVDGRRLPGATHADKQTSRAMNAYWVAFARTGDPGSAGGLPWPRYTPGGDEMIEFGNDGIHATTFPSERLDWLVSQAAKAPAR